MKEREDDKKGNLQARANGRTKCRVAVIQIGKLANWAGEGASGQNIQERERVQIDKVKKKKTANKGQSDVNETQRSMWTAKFN